MTKVNITFIDPMVFSVKKSRIYTYLPKSEILYVVKKHSIIIL